MKLFRKLIFYYLLFTISCLLLQSCQLEPEITGNVVEPQILDYEGSQIGGPEYANASIGPSPVVFPNVYGYCRFENVTLPYDLVVSRFSFPIYYQVPYIYKTLKIRNPKINVPYGFYRPRYNVCLVPVKFPPIPQNKVGYLKFISNEQFKQLDSIYFIDPNISIKTIEIGLPLENQSITGNLIYMQCSGHAYFTDIHITSFDKFGIKKAVINTEANDTIFFNPKDVAFDPPESQIDFRISYPETPWYNSSEIYLSFPEYNINSDLIIRELWYYDHINQTVPSILNIPYQIKVKSKYVPQEAIPYYVFQSENLKIVNLQPGSSEHITHEKLNLLNPRNNQEGINENSYLTVQDNQDEGVYIFFIETEEPYGEIHVITDRNSIRLGDLHYRNFNVKRSTKYSWCAAKISSFNSIDEFAEKPFIFNKTFHTVQISDAWYFKTAP